MKQVCLVLFLFALGSQSFALECEKAELVKEVPAVRPKGRDDLIPSQKLLSYTLKKKNGTEFIKLESSYIEKHPSYSLAKFDSKACLSIFSVSTNWEGSFTEIYDHLTGSRIQGEMEEYAISADGSVLAVWSCNASQPQSDFGSCVPNAQIRFYFLKKNGDRAEAGVFNVSDLPKQMAPADIKKYQKMSGVIRIYLEFEKKNPLAYVIKITSNENPDEDLCGSEELCHSQSFTSGPMKFEASDGKILLAKVKK